MQNPKILRLYKYASFSARSIASLIKRKLWFPSASTFNDPFDCAAIDHVQDMVKAREKEKNRFLIRRRHSDGTDPSAREVEDRLRRLHNSIYTKAAIPTPDSLKDLQGCQDKLQSYLYGLGILSLSETPRSILMWSHYAAQHTGICFEFERLPDNKLGTEARPIKYDKKREIALSSNNEPNLSPIFQKYSGWKYEGEWRLVENKGDQLYDFPGRLVSVICGARMSFQDIETLQKLIDSLNSTHSEMIATRFAKMKPTTYAITITQVKPEKP